MCDLWLCLCVCVCVCVSAKCAQYVYKAKQQGILPCDVKKWTCEVKVDMRGRHMLGSTAETRAIVQTAVDLRKKHPREMLEAMGMNWKSFDMPCARGTDDLRARFGAATLAQICDGLEKTIGRFAKAQDSHAYPLHASQLPAYQTLTVYIYMHTLYDIHDILYSIELYI